MQKYIKGYINQLVRIKKRIIKKIEEKLLTKNSQNYNIFN